METYNVYDHEFKPETGEIVITPIAVIETKKRLRTADGAKTLFGCQAVMKREKTVSFKGNHMVAGSENPALFVREMIDREQAHLEALQTELESIEWRAKEIQAEIAATQRNISALLSKADDAVVHQLAEDNGTSCRGDGDEQ